jgi:iron complex transport system substrate-binding protein
MRIVSLLPSATEIVCALGARDELVGVSHECDFPEDVRTLPAVTRAKIRVDGTSDTIDAEVRDLVRRGLSVYEIDVERLRSLAPDVIVTQDQCDVCAVSYAEVERAAREALDSTATIVSLRPQVLADVWADVRRVGAALGRDDTAAALVDDAHARLATLAVAPRARPVVACIEWIEPLMLAGNWMPELVELAGGSYPFASAGAASGVTSWQELVAAGPDLLVVMPCGFGLAQTRRELPRLTARPEWRDLRAVRAGRVFVADGNAYFNRPGPRLVESAAILAALIDPARGVVVPPGAVESIPG